MAFDAGLAERVREVLGDTEGLSEKRMFGGAAFLVHGNMCCGILGDDLIVRVGPDAYDDALAHDHARVFDITGRVMRGWVMVAPAGYGEDAALAGWIDRGLAYATGLPPK